MELILKDLISHTLLKTKKRHGYIYLLERLIILALFPQWDSQEDGRAFRTICNHPYKNWKNFKLQLPGIEDRKSWTRPRMIKEAKLTRRGTRMDVGGEEGRCLTGH